MCEENPTKGWKIQRGISSSSVSQNLLLYRLFLLIDLYFCNGIYKLHIPDISPAQYLSVVSCAVGVFQKKMKQTLSLNFTTNTSFYGTM